MTETKKHNFFNLREKAFYYQTVSPLRVVLRVFLRLFLRILIRVLVKFEINGRENLPKKGPAILIANHMDYMESALMMGFAPRQIEMLSAIDYPFEPLIGFLVRAYGIVPVFRGKTDRKALKTIVRVLKKNGFIGIFPEGSTWEPGLIVPKSGFAWMSSQSGAAIVPIAFSGLINSTSDAFQFKRPRVVMTIGESIPALEIKSRQTKKEELETYTQFCWDKVINLLEPEEYNRYTDVENERFKIEVLAFGEAGKKVKIPETLNLSYEQSAGLLFYRTKLFRLFVVNYLAPVEPLQLLHTRPSPDEILIAIDTILHVLEDEETGNPYVISFHLGVKEGEEIRLTLHELKELYLWAKENKYSIHINPKRLYYSTVRQKEIVQTRQKVHN